MVEVYGSSRTFLQEALFYGSKVETGSYNSESNRLLIIQSKIIVKAKKSNNYKKAKSNKNKGWHNFHVSNSNGSNSDD